MARSAPPVVPAQRVGVVTLATLATAAVAPVLAPAAGAGAWVITGVRTRRDERARLRTIAAGLPDVVDLLVLGLDAGLTVPLALDAVARRGHGPLADELARVLDQVRLGRPLADALDELPGRLGESVRPLTAALASSERYGAPVVPGLHRPADEGGRPRRRQAAEAARRVPVKLLFPLVTCSLPAFVLLTVAPLVAGAVRALRL
jgi:tight adherence protein C